MLVVPQRSSGPWARTPWWVIEGTAAVNFRKSLLSARRATVFFILPTSEQIRALATRCEQFRDAKAPGGYPDSLALCIVDSVQSTGIRYGTTAKVVNRYRTYRTAQGGDPETDSVSDYAGPGGHRLRAEASGGSTPRG